MTYELATGGTITVDTPTLVEHRFTSGGTFALINAGTLNFDYAVVAGGGGATRGGGGAGGVRTGTSSTSSSNTVTVGSGGSGKTSTSNNQGNSGGASSISSVASCTGGGGGGGDAIGLSATYCPGNPGGSGGGGGTNGTATSWAGGTGTSGEGNNGGTNGAFGASSPYPSGGGGGGGGNGGTGGNGGSGVVYFRYNPSTGWSPAVPGPPTGATAVGGNAQATVSFTAPAYTGTTPITGYTVTSSPGGFTNSGASSPIVVSGLTNGTPYTFSVVATNSGGNSAPSSPSNSVVPSTVPNPPTAVTAIAGSGEASISFTPPINDGGDPIIDYTVTSSPGGFSNSGAGAPIIVSGLTGGVSYTFTVVATNSNGDSAPSAPSNSVIPSGAVFSSYPVLITAQLLDYDGTVLAPGTQLDNGFDINWYDEFDGPGRGGCSLSLSEAGSADLLPGRYINCLANGVVRFTFKIEGNPNYKVIARGEEHDQIIEVQGRGWGCVLDETVILPDFALNFSLQTNWRLFSFASPSFPNSASWDPAVEQAEYLDGVTTAACYGHFQTAPDGLNYPAPIGWPWSTNPANLVMGVPTSNYVDTYWIRTDNQPDYASTGYWLFINQFTLDDFTPVTFTVTGDNFFTFFLEGVPVLGEAIDIANHWMWQGWKEQQIWLPAGEYTVAAAVYNIAFSEMGATPPYPYQPPCPSEGWAGGNRDSNAGGLLVSIFSGGDNGTVPVPILMSNDTWISWYDPTTWPGWTPGQIINQLIGEALTAGYMTVYDSVTFSDVADSHGDVWRPYDVTVSRPDLPTLSVEVGTSIMAALGLMVDQGYIHWHMQPETFILDVYRGRNDTPSPTVTLAGGVNLAALEKNATAPYANYLLVQWAGGYIEVKDLVAIAAYGTMVGDVFSSDAPSAEEAEIQGNAELARRAQEQFPAIVVVIEPTSLDDCPYEGFGVGEYVTAVLPEGDQAVRCWSIACQQDDMGYAVWSAELNAKLDVPERRRTELLQTIGGKNQIVRGAVT